ncbi:MAG: Maf family protein, partial [Alphaproteobacteria bacterium]|nr:Maf family protein [Alphaproteobacteria bacterium]
MSLVLASASASRAQLLKAAGLSFDIEPADIDEEAITRKMLETRAGPSEVALALAEGKALKVSARRTGDTVVGGDQVLAFAGDLIGKCANLEDARRLLV